MVDMTALSQKHMSEATRLRLAKRRKAEIRLRSYGIAAISVAVLALVALVWSIFGKAAHALMEYYVPVEIALDLNEDELARLREPNPGLIPDLSRVLREGLARTMPYASDRQIDDAYALFSTNDGFELGQMVKRDPSLVGQTIRFDALLDDVPQLYLKGYYGSLESWTATGVLSPIGTEGEVRMLSTANDFADELEIAKEALLVQAERNRVQALRQQNAVDVYSERMAAAETEKDRVRQEERRERAVQRRDALNAEADALQVRASIPGGEEALDDQSPSVLIEINGGWARVNRLSNTEVVADVIRPLASTAEAQPGEWSVYLIEAPAAGRPVTDEQIVMLELLERADRIVSTFNWRFFTAADSRNAELAGLYGALIGSLYTMAVTFIIAFPIGVAAALYLEEFAPKNRVTNFIEVNINNLAAVPSIVFGLLGLAVALPLMNQITGGNLRSAPLIGGLVLALMSLPTIIIASRAAIRAVPPSIREAALGVGASRLQTATHHVLPLAMPGILTGTIIALAQALGETAPLIMIGMVAFIVDVPGGVTESATVLPVQIFRWSDFPEKLFELKTSLAIVTLLAFLVVMNALAVILRKRFERRW